MDHKGQLTWQCTHTIRALTLSLVGRACVGGELTRKKNSHWPYCIGMKQSLQIHHGFIGLVIFTLWLISSATTRMNCMLTRVKYYYNIYPYTDTYKKNLYTVLFRVLWTKIHRHVTRLGFEPITVASRADVLLARPSSLPSSYEQFDSYPLASGNCNDFK